MFTIPLKLQPESERIVSVTSLTLGVWSGEVCALVHTKGADCVCVLLVPIVPPLQQNVCGVYCCQALAMQTICISVAPALPLVNLSFGLVFFAIVSIDWWRQFVSSPSFFGQC